MDIRPLHQLSGKPHMMPSAGPPDLREDQAPSETDSFRKSNTVDHRRRRENHDSASRTDHACPEPAQEKFPAAESKSQPVPLFLTMDYCPAALMLEDIMEPSTEKPFLEEELPVRRKQTRTFIEKTEAFRTSIQAAKNGDRTAAGLLRKDWGYTPATLPAEGTLYIDPYFMRKDLHQGAFNALQFPGGGTSEIETPSLEKRLFGSGKPVSFPDGSGGFVPVTSMSHYREAVATARAERLRLEDDSGMPMEVNMAFRGEGGRGKRYGAAFSEMFRLGVVPASASGVSSGSIAAALVACGADPATFQRITQDERLSSLLDGHGPGGAAKGFVAYEFLDEVFREITGIHDRPVTFADLRMPLTILGAKYSDSAPPPGTEDLSTPERRKFIFSRETTPHTPVALAVRASISLPGIFMPVEMIDPVTGRTLALLDGGVVEDFPVSYGDRDKPTVALHSLMAEESRQQQKPLFGFSFPKGQQHGSTMVQNALSGLSMQQGSRPIARDREIISNPPENTFIIGLPSWDLDDPSRRDTVLSFEYDPHVDPRLDSQTTAVIDGFLSDHLLNPRSHETKASNLDFRPRTLEFERQFEYEGKAWKASYRGGKSISLESSDGDLRTMRIKKQRIENWLIEDAAFGDLAGKLRYAMKHTIRRHLF